MGPGGADIPPGRLPGEKSFEKSPGFYKIGQYSAYFSVYFT